MCYLVWAGFWQWVSLFWPHLQEQQQEVGRYLVWNKQLLLDQYYSVAIVLEKKDVNVCEAHRKCLHGSTGEEFLYLS